jgi:uncharacterized protein involved in cysteine biosynthesis
VNEEIIFSIIDRSIAIAMLAVILWYFRSDTKEMIGAQMNHTNAFVEWLQGINEKLIKMLEELCSDESE